MMDGMEGSEDPAIPAAPPEIEPDRAVVWREEISPVHKQHRD
jgi:hypothetical protein